MPRDLAAIRDDATVESAIQTARETRHVSLPVVHEGGGLVGLVALADLARVPAPEAGTTHVGALVHDLPVTAAPDEPAVDVLARMAASGHDHVAVMDHGTLVGLVSRSDFARIVEIGLALQGHARPRASPPW